MDGNEISDVEVEMIHKRPEMKAMENRMNEQFFNKVKLEFTLKKKKRLHNNIGHVMEVGGGRIIKKLLLFARFHPL